MKRISSLLLISLAACAGADALVDAASRQAENVRPEEVAETTSAPSVAVLLEEAPAEPVTRPRTESPEVAAPVDRSVVDFSGVRVEGELSKADGDDAPAFEPEPAPSKRPTATPKPPRSAPKPEPKGGIEWGRGVGDADSDGSSIGVGALGTRGSGAGGGGYVGGIGGESGGGSGHGYTKGSGGGGGSSSGYGMGRGGTGSAEGRATYGKPKASKRAKTKKATEARASGERERRARRPRRPPPSSAGVKAGAHDDNLQFNAFLDFLAEHDGTGLYYDVSDRRVVRVTDQDGLPLAGAKVSVLSGSTPLISRTTYADGRAMLFPSADTALRDQDAKLRVDYRGHVRTKLISAMDHDTEIRLDLERAQVHSVPLDIAFVLDTTGSMGDEIAQLKKTLEVINFQLSHLEPRPDVRFSMVLYRDRTDDYVTKVVPFTRNVRAFQILLNELSAGGGGDFPEDVQAGLRATMRKLDWRTDGVRIAFLIGDAPPHLDYGQSYSYVQAMREAASRGIKIAAIGASGLDSTGEVVWRQLAQYTMAPFVFLTYGEKGDSAGSPSSVSHHVGSNWMADNLDAIVVRMVKVELAHYAPKGAPIREDYFSAVYQPGSDKESVLGDLFSKSIKQLTDYAVERIEDRTPTLVLPVAAKASTLDPLLSKLESRLAVALSSSRTFQLLERARLNTMLQATADQMKHGYDGAKMVEVGKLVPARLAVLSQLESETGGKLEMLVKLVRLETGEVLSLSLLKIDRNLI